MTLTHATARGARGYQEDRFVIHSTQAGALLGVIDGHGGATAAERAAIHIPTLWELTHSFVDLFSELDEILKHEESGCAVSLVWIPKESCRITIAVLGDAPVIVDTPTSLLISPEHNVRTNLFELEAAQKRGALYDSGYIHYGNSGLQMSRALGDSHLRPILSQTPQVYEADLRDFVLLGTDGLFDPAHYNAVAEIANVATLIRAGTTAQELVDRAVAKPTNDNATAILLTKFAGGIILW